SGAPIYGANEGPFPDPYGDPVGNGIMDWCGGHTGGNADYHYHTMYESMLTDQDGDGEPTCMDADETTVEGEGISPILGYSLDGFAIYGARDCLDADCSEVVEFLSGWENTGYLAGSLGCETTTECGNPSGCDNPQTAANFECYSCTLGVIDGEVTRACMPTTYSWDNHTYVAKDGDQWLDECNGRVGPDGTYRYHVTSTFPYTLGCYRGTAEGAVESGGGGPGGGGPPGGGPPGG
ncbi:MAG: YHYH protein, partial [Myxococcota bacterium]|nr:YHYH protein [Myxococcota bacterium]